MTDEITDLLHRAAPDEVSALDLDRARREGRTRTRLQAATLATGCGVAVAAVALATSGWGTGPAVSVAGMPGADVARGVVPDREAGEPWTDEEILAFIEPGGWTAVPQAQRAAVADGVVTWDELEAATREVETCFEAELPGLDLSYQQYEFDTGSGRPTTLVPALAHRPDVSTARIDQVLNECEQEHAMPLTVLYQQMHTDTEVYQRWLDENPPAPGGQLWINGTPVPEPPS